jgi:aconitase A
MDVKDVILVRLGICVKGGTGAIVYFGEGAKTFTVLTICNMGASWATTSPLV